MKFIFISFFILSQSLALDCPDGTYEVKVDLSFSEKLVKFCQKNVNGKYVKHGPEQTFDMSGNIISEKFFINNIESNPNTPQENISGNDFCNGEQDYVKEVVKSLFVNDSNIFDKENELVIRKCEDCCRGYPKKRLNFFFKNKPFTNSLKFKKQCDFQGDLIFQYDKRVDTEFKLKGQPNYDHLKISYLITKSKKGKIIILNVKLLNGEFSKNDSENFLKFSAIQEYEVDTALLLMSKGSKGFYSNPPIVKIIQIGDKICH